MGSFGDFIIARTGMMSSQMALNITGQNISNINTSGYTRRTLDQSTFVVNGSGLYRSSSTVYAGAGVMMNGVSQLRDPYLDIRFRNEMSGVGSADSLLAGMEQIDSVINDVGVKGITTQLQDLLDKFGKLNANKVGTAEFDNLIKNSAESLCQLFNLAASKLQDVKDNYETKYKEEVGNVDTLIQNIRDINEQIRKADINGDSALELRDQRNMLLDELSQYMKVDITYDKEDLGCGVEIEKLTIKMVDNSPGKPRYTLVDGINSANIEMNDDYSLKVSALKDRNGDIIRGNTDADLDGEMDPVTPNGDITEGMGYGALESMRQILTGQGEYSVDGTNATKGIPYYQASLDALAGMFAEEMNKLNTKAPDGTDLTIDGAGDLFEAAVDGKPQPITAANISISDEWRNGTVSIVASTQENAPSDANDNILRFQDLFSKNISYEGGQAGSVIYNGTFEGFYANMQGVLGLDIQTTSSMYDTYATAADDLNNSRDGVSGVDLNEEGVNMMQYQKAFAASCRMITALDELMDQVINRMGV